VAEAHRVTDYRNESDGGKDEVSHPKKKMQHLRYLISGNYTLLSRNFGFCI